MKTTNLFVNKEILHNLPFEGITVTIDKTTTGTVDENGRKILKAGTLLAGDGASIFKDRTKKAKAVEASAGSIDGVLLYDVDVTDEDTEASLVYRGTVYADKVAGYTDEVDAKLPGIKFVKGA